MRGLVKGKRWLLLSRWVNLNTEKKRQLNQLFGLNRRMLKAYLLKESLSRLWDYRYEGAMLRYLQNWIDQLRWQRLKPLEKLAPYLLLLSAATASWATHLALELRLIELRPYSRAAVQAVSHTSRVAAFAL